MKKNYVCYIEMDKVKKERKPRQPEAEKPKAEKPKAKTRGKRIVRMTNFKHNLLEIII